MNNAVVLSTNEMPNHMNNAVVSANNMYTKMLHDVKTLTV